MQSMFKVLTAFIAQISLNICPVTFNIICLQMLSKWLKILHSFNKNLPRDRIVCQAVLATGYKSMLQSLYKRKVDGFFRYMDNPEM